MNSSVVILVLLSAFMHAAWNFTCKSKAPSAAFFAISTASSVVAMIPLYIYFAPRFHEVPAIVWGLIVATGFCQAIYYIGLANAYRLHDISYVYPIARSLPVLLVPLVCLVIGYGEPLRARAYCGMLVVVLGCLVLALKSFEVSQFKNWWHPAVIFIVLASLGTTGYTVIDSISLSILKQAIPSQPDLQTALFYISAEYFMVAFFMALYSFSSQVERAQMGVLKRESVYFPICSGITGTLCYGMILVAMQHATNVSYVTALRQFSIILGVIMGIVWLKEKASLFKLSGVVLIVAGLVMTVLK